MFRYFKNIKKNNFKLVIVSNKPHLFVNKILKHFNIYNFFSSISGGDTFSYRKPDPRHLLSTIENAGVLNYDCCFVGDSINDAICAKKAKVKLILLRHGYSNKNLDSMKANKVIDDLKYLPQEVYKLI